MQKAIVVIMFGGKSTEHEVSCRSARYLFDHCDRSKFDLAALAVDKQGRLWAQNVARIVEESSSTVSIRPGEEPDNLSEMARDRLLAFSFHSAQDDDLSLASQDREFVVFSVMHGTYGEGWQHRTQ